MTFYIMKVNYKRIAFSPLFYFSLWGQVSWYYYSHHPFCFFAKLLFQSLMHINKEVTHGHHMVTLSTFVLK